MTQTILIFFLTCVVSYFYYVYTTKKAIIDNFDIEKAKANLVNHISKIINKRTPYLKDWLKERPIDSFTDTSIAVSLKAKYQRVDSTAHLILSNEYSYGIYRT